MQKAGLLRASLIIVGSCLLVARTCLWSLIMRITRTSTRARVDKEIQAWSRGMLKLAKVDFKIVNPHKIKPKAGIPTIVMCNHSSIYDIPLSLLAFKGFSLRMLAKKELSKIPIMGSGMTAAGFPFIDRKNKAQAIKDLKQVEELLKTGIVMWIAPEGTRSKDGKLAPFKKGGFITAIETKATIIPVGIKGAYDILPPHSIRANVGCKTEVHIGKPIDASTYGSKDELAKAVYESIEALLEDKVF